MLSTIVKCNVNQIRNDEESGRGKIRAMEILRKRGYMYLANSTPRVLVLSILLFFYRT